MTERSDEQRNGVRVVPVSPEQRRRLAAEAASASRRLHMTRGQRDAVRRAGR